MAEVITAARVPGCSIALVGPDGLSWTAGFGWADLRGRRPADSRTVYHLFSGTKLFTAVALLQLRDQGRLALHDSVGGILPELKDALGGITLIDLLSHRSGLDDSLRSFLGVGFPPAPPLSTKEALARYRVTRSRLPGSKVEYRNVNFALLGEVVSRVSGLEYVDYVRREVLEPLGMSAGFRITDSMRPHAATGYVDRWDPMRALLWLLFPDTRGQLYGARIDGFVELREFDLLTPAIGGLVGSGVDFARFLQAQLNDGGEVLSPESTRLMQTQIAAGAAGIESRVGMGLGWKVGRIGDRVFLNHEGGGAGFTSELRLYPDARLGIAVAMNVMRMPRTMRLAHDVCELVLEAHQRLG